MPRRRKPGRSPGRNGRAKLPTLDSPKAEAKTQGPAIDWRSTWNNTVTDYAFNPEPPRRSRPTPVIAKLQFGKRVERYSELAVQMMDREYVLHHLSSGAKPTSLGSARKDLESLRMNSEGKASLSSPKRHPASSPNAFESPKTDLQHAFDEEQARKRQQLELLQSAQAQIVRSSSQHALLDHQLRLAGDTSVPPTPRPSTAGNVVVQRYAIMSSPSAPSASTRASSTGSPHHSTNQLNPIDSKSVPSSTSSSIFTDPSNASDSSYPSEVVNDMTKELLDRRREQLTQFLSSHVCGLIGSPSIYYSPSQHEINAILDLGNPLDFEEDVGAGRDPGKNKGPEGRVYIQPSHIFTWIMLALEHLNQEHECFESVDDLVDAVEDMRINAVQNAYSSSLNSSGKRYSRAIADNRQGEGKDKKRDAALVGFKQTKQEGAWAKNLELLHDNQSPDADIQPNNFPPARRPPIGTADDATMSAAKQSVVAFLTDSDTDLLAAQATSSHFFVTDQEIEALLFAGGSVEATIDYLKIFNEKSLLFDDFQALVKAVRCQRNGIIINNTDLSQAIKSFLGEQKKEKKDSKDLLNVVSSLEANQRVQVALSQQEESHRAEVEEYKEKLAQLHSKVKALEIKFITSVVDDGIDRRDKQGAGQGNEEDEEAELAKVIGPEGRARIANKDKKNNNRSGQLNESPLRSFKDSKNIVKLQQANLKLKMNITEMIKEHEEEIRDIMARHQKALRMANKKLQNASERAATERDALEQQHKTIVDALRNQHNDELKFARTKLIEAVSRNNKIVNEAASTFAMLSNNDDSVKVAIKMHQEAAVSKILAAKAQHAMAIDQLKLDLNRKLVDMEVECRKNKVTIHRLKNEQQEMNQRNKTLELRLSMIRKNYMQKYKDNETELENTRKLFFQELKSVKYTALEERKISEEFYEHTLEFERKNHEQEYETIRRQVQQQIDLVKADAEEQIRYWKAASGIVGDGEAKAKAAIAAFQDEKNKAQEREKEMETAHRADLDDLSTRLNAKIDDLQQQLHQKERSLALLKREQKMTILRHSAQFDNAQAVAKQVELQLRQELETATGQSKQDVEKLKIRLQKSNHHVQRLREDRANMQNRFQEYEVVITELREKVKVAEKSMPRHMARPLVVSRADKKTDRLEIENRKLRMELDELQTKHRSIKNEHDRKLVAVLDAERKEATHKLNVCQRKAEDARVEQLREHAKQIEELTAEKDKDVQEARDKAAQLSERQATDLNDMVRKWEAAVTQDQKMKQAIAAIKLSAEQTAEATKLRHMTEMDDMQREQIVSLQRANQELNQLKVEVARLRSDKAAAKGQAKNLEIKLETQTSQLEAKLNEARQERDACKVQYLQDLESVKSKATMERTQSAIKLAEEMDALKLEHQETVTKITQELADFKTSSEEAHQKRLSKVRAEALEQIRIKGIEAADSATKARKDAQLACQRVLSMEDVGKRVEAGIALAQRTAEAEFEAATLRHDNEITKLKMDSQHAIEDLERQLEFKTIQYQRIAQAEQKSQSRLKIKTAALQQIQTELDELKGRYVASQDQAKADQYMHQLELESVTIDYEYKFLKLLQASEESLSDEQVKQDKALLAEKRSKEDALVKQRYEYESKLTRIKREGIQKQIALNRTNFDNVSTLKQEHSNELVELQTRLQAEIDKLKTEAASATASIATLQGLVDSKLSEEDSSRLGIAIKGANHQAEVKYQELADSQLSHLKAEHAQLQECTTALESKLEQAQDELTTLRQQVAQANSERNEIDAKLLASQNEFISTTSDSQQLVDDLRVELTALKSKEQDMKKKLTETQSTVQEITQKHMEERKALAVKTAELVALQSQFKLSADKVEELTTTNLRLEGKLEQLDAEMENSKGKDIHDEMDAAAEKARQKRDAEKAVKEAVIAEQTKHNRLFSQMESKYRNEIYDLKETVEDLEFQVETLGDAQEVKEQLESEIQELQEALNDNSVALADAEAQKDQGDAKVIRLTKQLTTMEEEVERLTLKVKQLRRSGAGTGTGGGGGGGASEAEIYEMEARIAKAQKQAQQSEHALHQAQDQILDLKDRLKKAELALDHSKKEYEALQKALEARDKKIDALLRKLENAGTPAENLIMDDDQFAMAQQALENAEIRYLEAVTELKQVKKELEYALDKAKVNDTLLEREIDKRKKREKADQAREEKERAAAETKRLVDLASISYDELAGLDKETRLRHQVATQLEGMQLSIIGRLLSALNPNKLVEKIVKKASQKGTVTSLEKERERRQEVAARRKQKIRQKILTFLGASRMFSEAQGDITATDKQLDLLVTAGNGIQQTLRHLRKLDRAGLRFMRFTTMVLQVKAAHQALEVTRRKVAQLISYPPCKIFSEASGAIVITNVDIDRVVAAAGTLALLRIFIKLLERDGVRCHTFKELVPQVERKHMEYEDLRDTVLAYVNSDECDLLTHEQHADDVDAFVEVYNPTDLSEVLPAIKKWASNSSSKLLNLEAVASAIRSQLGTPVEKKRPKSREEKDAARSAVANALKYDNCGIFRKTKRLCVRKQDIDELCQAAGGVRAAITITKSLDKDGFEADSFKELIVKVEEHVLEHGLRTERKQAEIINQERTDVKENKSAVQAGPSRG